MSAKVAAGKVAAGKIDRPTMSKPTAKRPSATAAAKRGKLPGTAIGGGAAQLGLADTFDAALDRVKQRNVTLRAELDSLLATLG